DEANLHLWELLLQELCGGQCLLRWDIAGGSHDEVGFAALIVAGPVPDTDALGAMLDCGIHIQILKVQLLVRNDDVDVVLAAEAVICDGQQTVHIRRKVNASNGSALVQNNIQKAGVLVRETVVVLSPNRGSDQQIQ